MSVRRTWAILAGAAVALGVWLVWVGLPAPPPEKARRLVARLSDFDEPYEIGHQIGGELASLGDVGLRALVDGLQREGSGVLRRDTGL